MADGTLRALADRVAAAVRRDLAPDALLLAGSVAGGHADALSDVDLIAYHHVLPTEERVLAVRDLLGGDETRWLAPPSQEGLAIQYRVDGVVVQVAHTAVARMEVDVARLRADPDPYLLKAVAGLHEGLPLHGEELIADWRTRTAYDDALRRAVVGRHWKPSALIRLEEHLAARDAELFRRQLLAEESLDLVAVLAAANRVFLSTFQLKRTRAAADRFGRAPGRLVDRLEGLHLAEPRAAVQELAALRSEIEAILADEGLLPGG